MTAVMLDISAHVPTTPELCAEFRKANSVACGFHHDCKAGGEAQSPRS